MATGRTPDTDASQSTPVTGAPNEEAIPNFFQNLASSGPSAEPGSYRPPVDDSQPPAAPSTAYPAPNPRTPNDPNPVRLARSATEIVKNKPKYNVHVQATSNNTIMTFTRPDGSPILTLSGGKVGFKNSQKSSFEAASKCALGILEEMKKEQEKGELEWELFLSGFGYGRDGFVRSLAAADFPIKQALVRVTDRTPIRIGGTRAQKQKRR